MTPFVSLRTSASLALGAAVIAAGTLLAGARMAGADPSTETVKAIDDRYTAFGGEGSLLGAPTGVAVDVPGGAERDYSGGAIYFSKDSGAHVMYGDILERYLFISIERYGIEWLIPSSWANTRIFVIILFLMAFASLMKPVIAQLRARGGLSTI